MIGNSLILPGPTDCLPCNAENYTIASHRAVVAFSIVIELVKVFSQTMEISV